MRRILWLLLLIIIAGVAYVGYVYYKAPAIPVAAADLDKGGAFSDAEKSALASACTNVVKKDTDKVCGCLVDKAATNLSRFERMMATATLQGKLTEVAGITKGLVDSGIPMDKVKAAEGDARQRITDLNKSCGVTQ